MDNGYHLANECERWAWLCNGNAYTCFSRVIHSRTAAVAMAFKEAKSKPDTPRRSNVRHHPRACERMSVV